VSSPTQRARPLPEQAPGPRPPLVRRLSAHPLSAHRLLAHPGVGASAVLTAAFLAIVLPPYLTLDPARSRSRGPADFPAYYPLLVTHIFLGAIVLVTACLQVWPWLRRRHPRVHRWAGRGYVGAVLAASPCVLVIAPLGSFGPRRWASRSGCAGWSTCWSPSGGSSEVGG
jgi:hypothetical protein